MPTTDEILEATDVWMGKVQAMMEAYWAEHYKNLVPPMVIVAGGRTYLKIRVKDGDDPNNWHAYAFVNSQTGDIYRPAGWKKPDPAKIIRGNVLDEHGGMKWAGPHGIAYVEQMKKG